MAIEVHKKQLSILSDEMMCLQIRELLKVEFKQDIEAMDQDELMRILQEQMGVARQYGLTKALSIATFVMAAWVLGVQFDTKMPAVYECLSNQDLTEQDKTTWLEQYTTTLLTKLGEE